MVYADAILVIEDDPSSASLLQESLETEGHPVILARTGQEGLRALRGTPVFLVLLDLRLPDMAGVEVMREIQRLEAPPEIVIVTAFASLESAVAAIEAGAAAYLLKPIDAARLRLLVTKLGAQRQLRQEHAALAQRIDHERHRLEALYEVSRQLAAVHDTEQILSLIVRETARLLGTEAVALRLLDGECFVLRAHTGPAAALTARARVKASESVSGLVLAAGAPVAIEDLVEDTQYDPAHTQGVVSRGFRGFLGVPLRVRGKVIGVLNVYTAARRRFAPEEISLLSALADQASVAIEAARLHEEATRRAQQLATLTELTRALTTVLDPPALARETLTAVQVLIPEAAGRVWEVTEDGAAVHLVASLGLREPASKAGARFAFGEGMIGLAAVTQKPVISADVRADRRFLDPDWAAAEGLVACIILPLIRGDRVSGGLTIFTRTPHAFTEEEVGLLRSFADQAAIALANARLFQREQARRRQLEAIRAATAEITRTLDLKDLLRLISQRSAELLGATSGSVTLWDETAQVLVPAAWHGHGEWFRSVRWKLGEGVAGTVAQRRQGVMVNDYRTSPFAHPLLVSKTPITAVLAEPLVYRDRLLGVLTVDSHDGQHPFTDADRHLLALFAAQAAVAIENARLYQQVQEQAGVLEQRVADRTAALQAAQLQLVQSEKLAAVGTLAAGVAHELNQPLMVIRGYAQELLSDPRIAEAEIREDLQRIEAQTTRMTAIITHLRDFSRQSRGKRQRTDLNQVVGQALTFVGQQLKLRNIAVVQSLDAALPPVWADPFQLEQVLLNLVTNARDAMEGTGIGAGTLTVTTRRAARIADCRLPIADLPEKSKIGNLQSEMLELAVTDTGPGIPPEVRARIFDPFFTTKEVGKGTGLGLSICHGIVQEHGGEIQVESPVADGRGTRITLRLPSESRGER
jgi:two-component system NtrC family sensor kinase